MNSPTKDRNIITQQSVWSALHTVMDPEIPVVSLVDMGIIREIEITGNRVAVTMTPTFSGCPALIEMKRLLREKMIEIGFESAEVKTQLNPPWTSDWITAEGRCKLRKFGLAPPPQHGGKIEIILYETVACPYCGSTHTSLKNEFGTTLCRSIYYCNQCQQPFEQFKAL